jgi:hypothetical protein
MFSFDLTFCLIGPHWPIVRRMGVIICKAASRRQRLAASFPRSHPPRRTGPTRQAQGRLWCARPLSGPAALSSSKPSPSPTLVQWTCPNASAGQAGVQSCVASATIKSSSEFPIAIVIKHCEQMESIVQFALVRWKNLPIVVTGSLRSDLNSQHFAFSSAVYPVGGSNCPAKILSIC